MNRVIATESIRLIRSQPFSSSISGASRAARAGSSLRRCNHSSNSSGICLRASSTRVSVAAWAHSSKENFGRFARISRDTWARGVSPSGPIMYLGKAAGSGLPPAVVTNGEELQFCTKPLAGLVSCGSSSKA